jgi:hypothetical protein
MTRGTQVHLSVAMGQTACNFGGYLNSPHKGCAHNRVIAVVLETVAINASDRALCALRHDPPIRYGHVSIVSGALHRFDCQYTRSK